MAKESYSMRKKNIIISIKTLREQAFTVLSCFVRVLKMYSMSTVD